jgi:hypothetical protein
LRSRLFELSVDYFCFQDFDLEETFGAVQADTNLEGTIELVGRMNGPYAVHEFALRVSLILRLTRIDSLP